MVDKEDRLPDGDGEGSTTELAETEDQGTLNAAYKKLSELRGEDGVVVSLTKQELGILKQLIHAPERTASLTDILLICDFLTEEEADDELEAYYEAKRLGMDMQFNIDHALSRAAVNRKGHRSSRAAMVMDAMSHQRFTSNVPKGKYDKSSNPRGPLS